MTRTSYCSLIAFASNGNREWGIGNGRSKAGVPWPFPIPYSRFPDVVRLDAEQHRMRILKLVLYVDEEQHGVLAVDDAVVVAHGEIHHRGGDYPSLLDATTIL